MVWYFDFCMYYLPNDPVFNTNRTLIFLILAVQALLYTILRFVLTHYQGKQLFQPKDNKYLEDKRSSNISHPEDLDQNDSKHKVENQSTQKQKSDQNKSSDENTSGINIMISKSKYHPSNSKQSNKLVEMLKSLDGVQLDKYFASFFGHHAVAAGMCTIYVPYYPFSLMCLVYLILGILCFFFYGFKYERTVSGLWIIGIIINVVMFFGSTSNIGMMNYDNRNDLCYGQEDLSAQ